MIDPAAGLAPFRRRQASTVPRVTIRWASNGSGNSRASAATTARALHVCFGQLVWRRSTASDLPRRSANISTSPDADDQANSTNPDNTVTKNR